MVSQIANFCFHSNSTVLSVYFDFLFPLHYELHQLPLMDLLEEVVESHRHHFSVILLLKITYQEAMVK